MSVDLSPVLIVCICQLQARDSVGNILCDGSSSTLPFTEALKDFRLTDPDIIHTLETFFLSTKTIGFST